MSGIWIRVRPKDINRVNQLIEGFEYFGLVTTLNAREGLLLIRSTPDMREEALAALAGLPVPVEVLTDKPE